MEAYGACHEEVVVGALSGTEGTVGFLLIIEEFVDAALVSLNIEALANDFDES